MQEPHNPLINNDEEVPMSSIYEIDEETVDKEDEKTPGYSYVSVQPRMSTTALPRQPASSTELAEIQPGIYDNFDPSISSTKLAETQPGIYDNVDPSISSTRLAETEPDIYDNYDPPIYEMDDAM